VSSTKKNKPLKTVKYIFIFLLFLTLGTYIATLFAPKDHTGYQATVISVTVENAWKYLTDTSYYTMWVQNAKKLNELQSSIHGNRQFEVTFEDEQGNVSVVSQKWLTDSSLHKLQIKSTIPDRLSMTQSLEITPLSEDSSSLATTIEVEVHGWLNRLLLSGAGASLQQKADDECESFKKRLQNLN
jgi:hypothetical protein